MISRWPKARGLALLLLVAVVPVLSVVANRAHAETSPSATVVVFARSDGALGRRVAAELAAMGLTVRMRPAPADVTLESAARDLRVDGAVRVSDDALEVWLLEPTSHRTVFERIGLGATETEQVTAVHRATEVLRTQLFEPLMAAASASASAAATTTTSASTIATTNTVTVASAAPSTSSSPATSTSSSVELLPWIGFWVGGAFAWSGPVTQSAFDLAAGAFIQVRGPLRLEASLTRSLTESSVTATAGTSSVEAWSLGLAARLRFGSARFGGGGGLGLAGVWLLLTGHANAPYLSDRADVLTFMPFAVAGLDVSPVRHFAIRADMVIGFTAPRASIVFADQAIADWGAPFVLATLAAEVHW